MQPTRAQIFVVALLVSSSACRNSVVSPSRNAASAQGETLWLTGNGLHLKTKIYRSPSLDSRPILIVVLHGDSPLGPPSYQYAFAARAAAHMENAVVAAILRPGYADDTGDRSTGNRGLATGDNYTPQVVDAVAAVVSQLKSRFHPGSTVLMGHSGGAAITADVLGRWPDTVDAALLVSCPCDLAAWRRHMPEVLSSPWWLRPITPLVWRLPVKSLSPVDLVSGVRRSDVIQLIVGSEDMIAPPRFSEEYAAALRRHGVSASVVVAPGLPHDILLEPVVFDQLTALRRIVQRGPGRSREDQN